jgi:hypothetical protein
MDHGITVGGSVDEVLIYLLQLKKTEEFPAGNFVYDLELESSAGIVSRIIEGAFIVTPEVTTIVADVKVEIVNNVNDVNIEEQVVTILLGQFWTTRCSWK